MTAKVKTIRVGIIGCGAIGSRIARSIKNDLKGICQLTALYDINMKKAKELADHLLISPRAVKTSLKALLTSSSVVIEATNAANTHAMIYQTLKAKKDVLSMSVGKLLDAQDLFQLATKNKCSILLPSGAVAGIDAIKAASLSKIQKIILTTRKPPSGFGQNPHLRERGIDLTRIDKETILFEGNVDAAVKYFPQNINVAATIALACQDKKKLTVRIITSPEFKTNSHEIEIVGDFGRISTRTDNEVCPDNPKTSYLAVLSGIQTLKQYCQGLKIGT